MPTITEHNRCLAKSDLPTVETLTRRILSVFDRASKSDVEAGVRWYAEQGAFCDLLAADEPHVSREQVAAVIAHLSPRTSWARNVIGATALIREGAGAARRAGCIGDNVDRAVAALDWDDPISSFGPKAHKTRSFYLNILGDDEAVTVDVWAARVADVDEALLKRVGVYAAVEAAYQRAARRRGVAPSTMQATTWVVVRGGRAG